MIYVVVNTHYATHIHRVVLIPGRSFMEPTNLWLNRLRRTRRTTWLYLKEFEGHLCGSKSAMIILCPMLLLIALINLMKEPEGQSSFRLVNKDNYTNT